MLSNLIGGLSVGSLYGLIAVGVALVYRTTGLVNFAQGELVAIGAYAYIFATAWGGSPLVTMLVALLSGMAAGAVFFLIIDVLLRHHQELRKVGATIALMTFIQGGARLLVTDRPQRAEAWLFGDSVVTLAGTSLPSNTLVILAVLTAIALGLYFWFSRTIMGKAMAAVAEDPLRAALSGIPVRKMLLLSWLVAGALAALAGVLISPATGVFPAMGGQVFLAATVGAVIGGLDSIFGAMLGGLLVGVVQTYAVISVGGAFRDLIVFGMLLAFLLFKPSGLFGSLRLRRV